MQSGCAYPRVPSFVCVDLLTLYTNKCSFLVKKYGTRGLRDRVSPPMTALAGRLWPAGRDRRQLCVCRLRLGLGRLRQLGLGRCPPLFVCAVLHAPRVRAHDARTMQAAGRCRHARRELSARQRRAGTRPARPTLHACAACADHASHVRGVRCCSRGEWFEPQGRARFVRLVRVRLAPSRRHRPVV